MTRFNEIWTKYIMNRGIRANITIGVLILLLINSVTISWYSYTQTSKALMDIADSLMEKTKTLGISHTLRYLSDARSQVILGGALVTKEEDVSFKNTHLISLMSELLSLNFYLSSFYIGTEQGKFLQIIRIPPNSTYRSDPSKILPGGTVMAIRYIERTPENSIESWHYYNDKNEELDTESWQNVKYNHKARDWYIDVINTRQQYWSNIYVFSVSKNPGITAAAPILMSGGQLMGVVGADIEMDQISKILKDFNVGKGGLAFIMTSKGEIVAQTGPVPSVKVEGDKIVTRTLVDLDDQRPFMAHQKYLEQKKNKIFFEYDNVLYLAAFADFPNTFGKEWRIGLIVPIDEFIGTAKATNKHIIMIDALLFLFLAFLVYALAGRIAYPVTQLAHEAIKIKNFQFENAFVAKTNVYELKLLNEAIASMRQSMQAFSKFIPKALVGKLLQRNKEVTIGGNLKHVTFLFSDVANFTNISEATPPDKLVVHLSEYFEEVTQIIMKNNGTIDKYIGDAVMAFWGAPIPDRKQVLNACRAALLAQKRLIELNHKWVSEGKPELSTRIGLHMGDAIIGNIGSTDRLNYTALGDSVNLAARLEGVNKMYKTKIIVSQTVYEELRNVCVARPLDVIAVKGKAESVKIYELVGLLGDDPRAIPSKEEIEFCKAFTKAFDAYLDQRFDDALKMLMDLAKKYGDDYVINLYIQRCKDFKKTPPPDQWDGTVVLTSK